MRKEMIIIKKYKLVELIIPIVFIFANHCAFPPPDHKSCDSIYPFSILLMNTDPSLSQEDKVNMLNAIVIENQRCRKKYDDFKKGSPFL